MVALFLDDNKTNDDSDGKENGKNKKMFISTINNFARDHAILYISLPSLHHYDMKIPNFKSPLYGVGEHIQKLSVSFS